VCIPIFRFCLFVCLFCRVLTLVFGISVFLALRSLAMCDVFSLQNGVSTSCNFELFINDFFLVVFLIFLCN
jgi:hypothetical protein